MAQGPMSSILVAIRITVQIQESSAGLRHVLGVRPNRAAKFRGGGAISDLTKINLPVWTTMMFGVSCQQIPDSTWAWIGFHFATHCNDDQKTKMLRPDAFWKHSIHQNATAVTPLGKSLHLPEPMGARQGKPGGPGPQNFDWVNHNAFVLTSNWPVYSLLFFVNLLKFVPPDVRF